jgi:UDP-N-acetylglucosamine 2-epimerase (non-hydrolysing)/GDP/UDP-N,N'-diacetylbacillosamine 2-epimerase (hydrolysing)
MTGFPRRTIAVITTSRADYGHLYWPLVELRSRPEIDVRLIAVGAHLSSEFGQSIDEVRRDGFEVDATVECLLSSDSDVGMAKTIGVAALGLADVLGRLRPDLLLLVADRYELLAPASVAVALRIPIAHIEGGEVSQGAIDDAIRNALTKLSHVHFTPTERARLRVIGMGEEEWRVHHVGAPSLDHLHRRTLPSRAELVSKLKLRLHSPVLLVAIHPLTIARDTLCEADAVFEALHRFPGQRLFCFPNADSGSRALVARAHAFCAAHPDDRVFVNVNPLDYWSLLRAVDALVGNSSSGIMETASLALPTVNIGGRQAGRERAGNVIDAPADVDAIGQAIARALDPSFRASLDGLVSPYGDGHASRRIADVLSRVPLGDCLLRKAPVPIRTV